MISWVCCGIVYIRFRKACAAQNIQSPYHSIVQPYGAYIAMVMFTLLCLTNGFTVFFPQNWSASGFLTAYIGIPIFVVMYVVHRIVFWGDKWAWDPEEVDMQTGLQEIVEAERPLKKRKGLGRVCMIIE
jgi:yeast amino acid transporter